MYYINEFISGGLITVLFTYAASFYKNHPEYIKIIAFLWGMPVLYFYILFIALSMSEEAAIDITYHALYGMVCTIIIMITTLYLLTYSFKYNNSNNFIIYVNILYLIFIISIYLWFKIYNQK